MEDQRDFGQGEFTFSVKTIRSAFIRKVYSILTVQLLITVSIIYLFVYEDSLKQWVNEHPRILYVPLALTLVFMIFLICCEKLRRKTPYNLIFLILFTLCEGLILGIICSLFETEAVLIAVGVTAIVVVGLTGFALQTKIDFTMKSGALFSCLLVLSTFGLLALIFQSEVLNILYASLGALIFSLYIVFDTQLIVGGKHKISISPEEYIFATLNIYLDVINLFLMNLSSTGSSTNN